jgi:NCS1 family nucleobase:cation symporter-1
MIADIATRRRDYDEPALFDARGRYGAADVVSLGTLLVASVVGWGLVVNTFSEDASWNNWQGYLLGPLGLGGRDGAWAFANLGVLAALVIGFVVTLLARRGTIARQESGAVA